MSHFMVNSAKWILALFTPPSLDALRKDEYSYGLQMVLNFSRLPFGTCFFFARF